MYRHETVRVILNRAFQNGMPLMAISTQRREVWDADAMTAQLWDQRYISPGDVDKSSLLQILWGDTGDNESPQYIDKGGYDYVKKWILDDCPMATVDNIGVDTAHYSHSGQQIHNDFWRHFDIWSMYHRSALVESRIYCFYHHIAYKWIDFAAGRGSETRLTTSLAQRDAVVSIQDLISWILDTMCQFYGQSVRLLDAAESFELFGRNGLPTDPLRTVETGLRGYEDDAYHTMAGPREWFVWLALVEAGFRIKYRSAFLCHLGRLIILGLLSDGLYRQRFKIAATLDDYDGLQHYFRHYLLGLDEASLRLDMQHHVKASELFDTSSLQLADEAKPVVSHNEG